MVTVVDADIAIAIAFAVFIAFVYAIFIIIVSANVVISNIIGIIVIAIILSIIICGVVLIAFYFPFDSGFYQCKQNSALYKYWLFCNLTIAI